MARYWQLLVKAQGDTKRANKAMRDLKRSSRQLSQAIGIDFRNIARVGAFALGAGLAASVKVGVDEMLEAQRVTAQTNAVIKSTGGAANVSADQLAKLAGKLSEVSAVDDELIQSGANVLLTFTNVRNAAGKNNDIFNQATQLALDMSTALGTDLKGANIQLGKALNNPVKGITALSRVGVSFTKEQKNMIDEMMDAGNIMGAQKIILAELTKEFGGSAAAAGGTASGAINKLKNNFAEMSATIVEAVVPSIAGMAGKLNDLVQRIRAWAATRAGQEALASLRAGLQQAASAIGIVASAIGKLIGFLYRWRDVLVPVAAGILAVVAALKVYRIAVAAAAVAQALFNVALTANPIGLIVLAVVALVAALVVAYKRSDKFRRIVDSIGAQFKKLWKAALPTLKGIWREAQPIIRVLKMIGSVYIKALIMYYKTWFTVVLTVYKRIWNAAQPIVKILRVIATVYLRMVITYYRTLWTVASSVFKGIRNAAQPVISVIRSIATNYLAGLIARFRAIKAAAIGAWAVVSGTWSRAAGLFNRVKNALNFSSAFSSIRDGFRDALNGIIRLWNNLEFKIPALKVAGKQIFGGASIGTKNLTYLAKGGTIRRPGAAIVGEAGPELVELPRGARVTPLGKAGGNTYNVTINAQQPVDTVAFMRSLRVAARMGTV